MPKEKASKKQKWYTESNSHGAASKWGQMIGEAFADAVVAFIEKYLADQYPDFVLLEPEQGKLVIRLETMGGTLRQLDHVIVPKNSNDPVALLESKWLKDARHHNDKGAWILQLKEIRKKYPTVRGAVAVLAGYWTEGVGVMFRSEAGVHTVLVATDDEVYDTLEAPINRFLTKHHLPSAMLDVNIIRESLPRPHDFVNALIELRDTGELKKIASGWFDFVRASDEQGNRVLGSDLVRDAIHMLLEALPENPHVKKLEIALQIDTGNTIYYEFEDAEEALEFIQAYYQNTQAILDKITPKPRAK